jgi:hypothetical protein
MYSLNSTSKVELVFFDIYFVANHYILIGSFHSDVICKFLGIFNVFAVLRDIL